MSNLSSVTSASPPSFVYKPPVAAMGATRILVKLDLASPHPARPEIVAAVLRGLRRASPMARLLLLEGTCDLERTVQLVQAQGLDAHFDDNVRVADTEQIPPRDYPNPAPEPFKYASLQAPNYLRDYDACINLAAFRLADDSLPQVYRGALMNLVNLTPCGPYALPDHPQARADLHHPDIRGTLRDLYFALGLHFQGTVLDVQTGGVDRVLWGDDLLAVEASAYRCLGQAAPPELVTMFQQRARLP